ncbi:hypothetical protein V1517DRAFT_316100 [Lipomyces orientalis]|uniref:Uncharacterized protein n=1 Tax=Lipomyces orientalis TaxID=1233043 RepID=A0ACC3TUS5_9ASCO
MRILRDGRRVPTENDKSDPQPPATPPADDGDKPLSRRRIPAFTSSRSDRQSIRLERWKARSRNVHHNTEDNDDTAESPHAALGATARRGIVQSRLPGAEDRYFETNLSPTASVDVNNDTEPRLRHQSRTKRKATTSELESSLPTNIPSKLSAIANSERRGRRVVQRNANASITDFMHDPAVDSSESVQSVQRSKEPITTSVLHAAAPTEIAAEKSTQTSDTNLRRTGRVIKPRNQTFEDLQKDQNQCELKRYRTTVSPMRTRGIKELEDLFSEEDEDLSSDLSDADEVILNDPDMMEILFPPPESEPALDDARNVIHPSFSDAEAQYDSCSSDTSYRKRNDTRRSSSKPLVVRSQHRKNKRILGSYNPNVDVDRIPKKLRIRDRMQGKSDGSTDSVDFKAPVGSKAEQLEGSNNEHDSYVLGKSNAKFNTEFEHISAAIVEQGHMVDTRDKHAQHPRHNSDEEEELPPTQLIDDENVWLPPTQLVERVSARSPSSVDAVEAPKMSMLSSVQSFDPLALMPPIPSQPATLSVSSSIAEQLSTEATEQLRTCGDKSFDKYGTFLAELDHQFPEHQAHLFHQRNYEWSDEEDANDQEYKLREEDRKRSGDHLESQPQIPIHAATDESNRQARAREMIHDQQGLGMQVRFGDKAVMSDQLDMKDEIQVGQTPEPNNTRLISEARISQTNVHILLPESSQLLKRRIRKSRTIPIPPSEAPAQDNNFVPDSSVQLLQMTKNAATNAEIGGRKMSDASVVQHVSSYYSDSESDVSAVSDSLPSTQAIRLESTTTAQALEFSDESTVNKQFADLHYSPEAASVISVTETQPIVEIPDSQPATSSLSTLESQTVIQDKGPGGEFVVSPQPYPPFSLSTIGKSDKGQKAIIEADSDNDLVMSRPSYKIEDEVNIQSKGPALDNEAEYIAGNEEGGRTNDRTSLRRSSRQRRPPKHLSPEPNVISTSRKARTADKFSPEYLLNNPKSALVDLPDLSMFVNEDAFRRLSIDDRREIMQYILPIDRSSSTSPVPGFFRSVVIQDSARQLQNDIALGRYTKSYAGEYNRAIAAIANGEADEYKDGQFELWWGQRARGIDVE